jgi:hypothetical protein
VPNGTSLPLSDGLGASRGIPRKALAWDDDQKHRGRLLLVGKGALLAHRLARPLAAESDEYEQRPVRDVGETPAAPLITGRPHRPELSPAPDDLRAPRPASVDARSAGKQAYRRYRRPRLGRPATSQRRSEPGFAGDRKLRCALHTADSHVRRRVTRRSRPARRGADAAADSRQPSVGLTREQRCAAGAWILVHRFAAPLR